jgi:hypothetical protein
MSADMATHIQISEDELRAHLLQLSTGPVHINPDIGPEGEVMFELNERHQTNLFGFHYRSRILNGFAVHRPADGQTTVVQNPWERHAEPST